MISFGSKISMVVHECENLAFVSEVGFVDLKGNMGHCSSLRPATSFPNTGRYVIRADICGALKKAGS